QDIDARPICSFEIRDNGIGFNEGNYKSFRTSDSDYKPGAKGIGRFLWLKAFDHVSVESVFLEDNKYKERKFDFIVSHVPISNEDLDETDKSESGSIV